MKNAYPNPPTDAPTDAPQSSATGRFDALARLLATSQSRRQILAGLAGGIAFTLGFERGNTGAASVCGAGGSLCTSNGECCSGICDPHLYRCLAQPSVCTGRPGAPAGQACGCVIPTGPPSSVIVSGVPLPPGETESPRQQVPAPPPNAVPQVNASCPDLPGSGGQLDLVGPSGTQNERNTPEPEEQPPPRRSGWNY